MEIWCLLSVLNVQKESNAICGALAISCLSCCTKAKWDYKCECGIYKMLKIDEKFCDRSYLAH